MIDIILERMRERAALHGAGVDYRLYLAAIAEMERQQTEIAKLRAALEPFQHDVEAPSLSKALGHIGREELSTARKAFTAHG